MVLSKKVPRDSQRSSGSYLYPSKEGLGTKEPLSTLLFNGGFAYNLELSMDAKRVMVKSCPSCKISFSVYVMVDETDTISCQVCGHVWEPCK